MKCIDNRNGVTSFSGELMVTIFIPLIAMHDTSGADPGFLERGSYV